MNGKMKELLDVRLVKHCDSTL